MVIEEEDFKEEWEAIQGTADILFAKYDQDHDGLMNQYEFCLFLWDILQISSKALARDQARKCWEELIGEGDSLNQAQFRLGLQLLWKKNFFETEEDEDGEETLKELQKQYEENEESIRDLVNFLPEVGPIFSDIGIKKAEPKEDEPQLLPKIREGRNSYHPRGSSEDSSFMAKGGQMRLKVFFESESEGQYKTFIVDSSITAEEFLPKVLRKFQIPDEMDKAYSLFEFSDVSKEYKAISPSSLMTSIEHEKKICLQEKKTANLVKKRRSGVFQRRGSGFFN